MLTEKLANDIHAAMLTKLAGLDNYWVNKVDSLEPTIADKGITNLWGLLNRRSDPVLSDNATFNPTAMTAPMGSVMGAALLPKGTQGFRGEAYRNLISNIAGKDLLSKEYLSNHDVKDLATKLQGLDSSPVKNVSTEELKDLAKLFVTMGNNNAALTAWE